MTVMEDFRLFKKEHPNLKIKKSKAVSTRHFSELGAIDRDQFAPSCPCPHGGNWNARSGS